MLNRIESTIAAIKRALLNDETIRKLMFNDSNNALQLSTPTVQQVDEYITTYPIFEFETQQNFEKNGMINIYIIDGYPNKDHLAVDATVQINVVFNRDKWMLVDNKIRPLQVANKIIQLVDNKKFTTSNPATLSRMQQLILNKKLVGYALLFDFTDGNSDLNNF